MIPTDVNGFNRTKSFAIDDSKKLLNITFHFTLDEYENVHSPIRTIRVEGAEIISEGKSFELSREAVIAILTEVPALVKKLKNKTGDDLDEDWKKDERDINSTLWYLGEE